MLLVGRAMMVVVIVIEHDTFRETIVAILTMSLVLDRQEGYKH